MSKSSGRLVERWHTTIPGVWANVFLVDPDTESLFVSDGWSVPYAALSLHRMDLESGTHIADVHTRRQWVMGVTLAHGHLFAATASRLFELRRTDLGVLKQWDKGLVRYTTQLVEHGRQLVTANHLAPTIGVFDPSTGRTARIRVGRKPIVFRHRDETRVIAGFDGKMSTLDSERRVLIDREPIPPVTAVAAGKDIWAVAGGDPQPIVTAGPVGSNDKPVIVRKPTDQLLRLSQEPWSTHVGSTCRTIACDDNQNILWCVTGDYYDLLLAVSRSNGRVLATFDPAPGHAIRHIDTMAQLVFTTDPKRAIDRNRVVFATSVLACCELPEV